MNAQIHSEITSRLNVMRSEGLISDYWVSWVGCAGKLEPKVCSWIDSHRAISLVRERIVSLLSDLVSAANIVVKEDTLVNRKRCVGGSLC